MDSPHAPDGSILIEVADDREDLRTEEEQAQEQAYQYELKSHKPGVDTEARWVRKGRHYRYRGLERTHTQNVLEAMAYNLKRMPGLLVLQSSK